MRRRLAAAALSLLAATGAATAGPDLFVGRWRAVLAEPAAAPLLRHGFVIANGKIAAGGFAPCADPVATPAEMALPDVVRIFGAGVDLPTFQRSHLLDASPQPALRLVCPKGEAVLLRTGRSELLAKTSDAVYRLRAALEEEPATPDGAFVGRADASFDCGRATSPMERLICRWPDALAADGAMGAAYQALRRSLGKEEARRLLEAQRAFNRAAAEFCRVDPHAPRDFRDEEPAADCMRDLARSRLEFLRPLKVASAGRLRIEPAIATDFHVPAAAGDDGAGSAGWITQDATPVLIGASPAVAAAFLAEVRRKLATDRRLIAGRNDLIGLVSRGFEVFTLDSRLVSLLATEKVDGGTRVPDRLTAINLDLATGKPVTLDAIFDRTPDWRDAVLAAIRPQLQFPGGFDAFEPSILNGGVDTVWVFGGDKATVAWTPNWSGPPEFIEIPAAALAPHIRPGSPWRPAGDPPRR